MKFGLGVFPTDEGVDPPTLARLAEERGFESLLFTDRLAGEIAAYEARS